MGDATTKTSISIEVKVTNRCNQDCFYCVNDDGPDRVGDLDGRHFATKLSEWGDNRERSSWHIREVRMTGGEPLMHLPAVIEIARVCRKLGIRSGINTNACLLDGSTARLLKDTSLETIKVSFDAADERTFRRMRGSRVSFEKNLEGIRTAITNGFRVVLRLTLCAYNCAQLIECYRMARHLGVEKFQVKPMVCSGRAVGSDAFLDMKQLRRAFRELARVVDGHFALPEILCWPAGCASGLRAKVCGSIDKIYFSATGDACICNFVPLIHPIGNLTQDPLEEILNRRRVAVWKSVRGDTILAGCPQQAYFP